MMTGPVLVPASRPDLALEFANTRYWRGREPFTETLNGPDDLLAWCAGTGGIPEHAVADARAFYAEQPRKARAAFDEALVLREALYRVFAATAAEKDPAADDLAALNAALATSPTRGGLTPVQDGYKGRIDAFKPSVAALLAPTLWAAGDLLVEPQRLKVRLCANPECCWLFLDDSKSSTRRWCTMSSCGNRAKAHAYYERQKKAPKKKG
jgi:predicted RNA-binding Zn ribbon-like protein